MLLRPASVPAAAGAGGPGAGGFFACPGGVDLSPRSFFACPGGIFTCPGGVTEAGRRSAAAGGWVGGGKGTGLDDGVAAGGGEVTGACFGWPALGVGVGWTATCVTGTLGVATAPEGSEVERGGVWSVFGMAGA